MTTAAVETIWVPRGRPVRNFVLACALLALLAAVVGWSGVLRPRLVTTGVQGGANTETGAFTVGLRLDNDAPTALDVVGVTGEFVDLDALRPVTLGPGATRELSISGRLRCGGEPVVRLRVRPPLGPTRTVPLNDLDFVLRDAGCAPRGLSRPSPPSAAR